MVLRCRKACATYVNSRSPLLTNELHSQYGGQHQGGINTPAQFSLVMLFTGASGEQHDYTDGWSIDGLFLYTGEGQQGDLTFMCGNTAIRDHVTNGKDFHLFAYVRTGQTPSAERVT